MREMTAWIRSKIHVFGFRLGCHGDSYKHWGGKQQLLGRELTASSHTRGTARRDIVMQE